MGLIFWALVITTLLLEFINIRGIRRPLDDWRASVADAPDNWRAFNMSMLGPWSAWRVSPLTYCEDTELPRVDKAKVASEVYLYGPIESDDHSFAAEVVGPWPGALEDPRLAYDSDNNLVMSMALFDGEQASIQISWPRDGLHVKMQSDRPQKNWVPIEIGPSNMAEMRRHNSSAEAIFFATVPQGPALVGRPVRIERPTGPPGTAIVAKAPTIQLGLWRGSTNFMLYNGELIGLVHKRHAPQVNVSKYIRNRGLPMYEHAVQVLEPVWPFRCKRMSKPFKITVRGFPDPMFVFPMSLDLPATGSNDVRISVGLLDCYAAHGIVPMDRIVGMLSPNAPDVLHLTLSQASIEVLNK